MVGRAAHAKSSDPATPQKFGTCTNTCLQNSENNLFTSVDSSFDSCSHISDENNKIGLTRELNVSSSVLMDM